MYLKRFHGEMYLDYMDNTSHRTRDNHMNYWAGRLCIPHITHTTQTIFIVLELDVKLYHHDNTHLGCRT